MKINSFPANIGPVLVKKVWKKIHTFLMSTTKIPKKRGLMGAEWDS
jgi:hypothetical protein